MHRPWMLLLTRFIIIFGDSPLDTCVVMSLRCDGHADVYWRRRLLLICKSKEEFAGFKCHPWIIKLCSGYAHTSISSRLIIFFNLVPHNRRACLICYSPHLSGSSKIRQSQFYTQSSNTDTWTTGAVSQQMLTDTDFQLSCPTGQKKKKNHHTRLGDRV